MMAFAVPRRHWSALAREDFEYKRSSTFNAFCCIEPELGV